MAIFYVNPALTSNGTGSLASPYNALPAITSGNRYRLRRGTLLQAAITVPGSATDVTIEAYGNDLTGEDDPAQPQPRVNPGATARWSVRVSAGAHRTAVQDLECFGAAGNGTQTVFGVYWGSGGTADAHDGVLRRCTIHDPVGNTVGDCNGVQWFGDRALIEDCEIFSIPDDGLWVLGLAPIIRRNRVYDIGRDSGLTGDNIQLTGASGPFQVYDNYLDHSNGLEKQCFIISGASAGSGGVFAGNTCVYPADPSGAGGNACVYSDQPEVLVARNRLFGGTYGALFDGGARQKLIGNLIVGAYVGATTANNPLGLQVHQNTLVDCLHTGAYFGAADATSSVAQNIFLRCQRGLATHGSIAKSRNLYWGNAAYDWASVAGGGSIEANALRLDPRLDVAFAPLSGSPVEWAGAHAAYRRDLYGRPFNNPPSVGAIEVPTARDVAAARHTRY